MRIRFFPLHALSSLLILSLSTCIAVSALSFDSLLRDLHQTIFRRSLPASLTLAPEGAVGYYQPPPGPIIYGPVPATAPHNPDAVAAPRPANTDNNGPVYGSKHALAATEGPDEPNDRSNKHVPSVTEIDAMIRKIQTASASRGVVQSLTSLVASIFVSLLHW
ncbi:hypothetical protein BDV12DRAFT_167764 [Aspergillus spectabilis]